MKGEIKMTKEKDIYTLCNDIHTDLEQYDAEPFCAWELMNMK